MPESTEDSSLSGFGANEWLVDEMYEKYQKDPDSVDKVWWDFFGKGPRKEQLELLRLLQLRRFQQRLRGYHRHRDRVDGCTQEPARRQQEPEVGRQGRDDEEDRREGGEVRRPWRTRRTKQGREQGQGRQQDREQGQRQARRQVDEGRQKQDRRRRRPARARHHEQGRQGQGREGQQGGRAGEGRQGRAEVHRTQGRAGAHGREHGRQPHRAHRHERAVGAGQAALGQPRSSSTTTSPAPEAARCPSPT